MSLRPYCMKQETICIKQISCGFNQIIEIKKYHLLIKKKFFHKPSIKFPILVTMSIIDNNQRNLT